MKRVFALLMALVLALPAAAETYPSRPVRVIVPYQAGQGTDVAARYFAERLSKALGQQFIVDNRPGAGGNIGTEAVAHAAPDGYTLLMGTNATQTMNEFLYPSTGYDAAKDFAPVVLVGMLPMVVAANPDFAPGTIPELVAAAKAQPDKINVALPSTSARVVFEFLKERTGAPLFGVPYKGSGTAMTEVMGGQVQLIVDTATALRGHVQSGKLKAIAITTLKSGELLPGVKSVRGRYQRGAALKDLVASAEREIVLAALEANAHHIANTARELGLERSHLYKKMKALGIDHRGAEPEPDDE